MLYMMQLGQSHMLEAEQRTEELEGNGGGKTAQQGCDRASVGAPLLQHKCKWGWGGDNLHAD